ncbi:M1 family metallopeptidase [Nocardioides sp. Bht2]|uniref:M1 family metallopeptidase n=1 Tax=Nocardioides sp. Bht2 TaxID=3392297 RepID=UPI0039B6AC87
MRAKLTALIVALVVLVATAVTVAVLVLRDGDKSPASSTPAPSEPASPSSSGTDEELITQRDIDPADPALDAALSTTVEDSVYPNVGDPSVDALKYHLDLTWTPEGNKLDGIATIAFRAARTQAQFQLDLGESLKVNQVVLDGVEVKATQIGKDLVVESPITTDDRHLVTIAYSGAPEPFDAPTTRSDFTTLGWTVTDDAVWTMQEPYGAFTWYPVNDQPADKAFYDFTVTVPAPYVGVANGELLDKREVDGQTITEFRLHSPASSYLTTIAIDDYVLTQDKSASGVPLTYWTPRDQPSALKALRYTPKALAWLERRLGPYPFDRLGSVVVPSESAMETQTTITYGNTDYALAPGTVLHEIAHHWYGNIVSPTDWRDVWMNEGMTTYLEFLLRAETEKIELSKVLREAALYERQSREADGPPGDYDPRSFAQTNVYYSPALMWHEVREKVGEQDFWVMVRAWPTLKKFGNATRDEYLAWVQKQTGTDLSDLFDAWLLGETTPAR